MPVEIFNDGKHKCLSFSDLVQGEGVQANQFLIVNGDDAILLDPGGQLTFTPLSLELRKLDYFDTLNYIFASHQDPDIISSIDSWIARTPAKVVASKLWARFLPHLLPAYMGDKIGERIISVQDEGMRLPFGDTQLLVLPAHFLHSVGNLQIFDPVSKILFSGDMGASLVEDGPEHAVENFDNHIQYMEGFHKRYMVSNKVCRLWANMIRQLDVQMMVPQHGQSFKGPEMINQFLDWISDLECGVDLLTDKSYSIPE